MSTIVQGVGTVWNLPNYHGELFTADPVNTPLLSMSGGMTGGMITRNFEFPTAQLYSYPDAKQPEISEKDSIIAPEPRHIVRKQLTNVVQIHHTTLNLSYFGLGNSGRLSGVNTAGHTANPLDELAWQIQHSLLIPAARDIEHSFIQGEFNKTTASDIASKTRGMLQVCGEGGVVRDAQNTKLSFELLQELYRMMADNGAYFNNMVMFVNATLKQKITTIYSKLPGATLPATRTDGGINITNILTDFCQIQVVWNRFMPEGTVLLCDMSYISPVFMETPNKGVFFVEEYTQPYKAA
ncbi:MAG: DUF5309 domain-containing protein [Defluviitaleaceae bacterium]|nr:DUF5309 domain-containing protein [Defluviitaleaceae bacterium]